MMDADIGLYQPQYVVEHGAAPWTLTSKPTSPSTGHRKDIFLKEH